MQRRVLYLKVVTLYQFHMGLGGRVVSVSVFHSAIVRVGRFESQSPIGRATFPTTEASVTAVYVYRCGWMCELYINKRSIWVQND